MVDVQELIVLAIVGAIGLVIAIGALASSAPTVSTQTKTTTGGALENESATSKLVWSNIPVLYALVPLFIVLGFAFGFMKKHKK